MKVEVEHSNHTGRISQTRAFGSYGLYGCTCVLLVLFNSKSDKSANSQDHVKISTGVAVLILGHDIAHSPPRKLRKGALNSYQHPNHESAPLQLIRGLFRGLQAVMITNETFGIRQIHVFR